MLNLFLTSLHILQHASLISCECDYPLQTLHWGQQVYFIGYLHETRTQILYDMMPLGLGASSHSGHSTCCVCHKRTIRNSTFGAIR